MNTYMLVDLDNCIADDEWRVPAIDWSQADLRERFHLYHTLSLYDALKNAHVVHRATHEIVIVTARHESYRDITLQWLERNDIRVARVLMRGNQDFRPSVELKREMVLLRLLKTMTIDQIQHAYDDRPAIVEMYRSLGIAATVLQIVDIEHREAKFEKRQ